MEQGFPGAFYYIGNEECQTDCAGTKMEGRRKEEGRKKEGRRRVITYITPIY